MTQEEYEDNYFDPVRDNPDESLVLRAVCFQVNDTMAWFRPEYGCGPDDKQVVVTETFMRLNEPWKLGDILLLIRERKADDSC